MPKPEILFVGNYCRSDYLSMLDKALESCNFTFLEYISPKEEDSKSYLAYGKAVYWSQFRDVTQLLEKVAPSKVVFLFIESYNHIILNLACKRAAIPTYHLEHGLRADYILNAELGSKTKQDEIIWSKYLQKISMLSVRFKNRLFLKRSIASFTAQDKQFLHTYFETRRKLPFLETSKRVISLDRVAAAYISFSPKIFDIHRAVDFLPASYPVKFIGIPYFDALASVTPIAQVRAILFIDQPLAEHNLLNWTPLHKKKFIEQLIAIANLHNYKIYVKLHPKQDLSLWGLAENVEFISNNQLQKISGSAPVILGFFSTLLLPLAAMPHTTVITLENHPVGRLDLSKSFVDAGVAYPIYSLEELTAALNNIEQLHQQQLPNKAKFTEEWMYKFDGKSGERLREILLSNEL